MATCTSGGCTTPGCTNPVTKPLACPKCMQLGIRNVFCGQKCFKENYAQHKQIHAILQQMGAGGGGVGGHRKTPPDGIVCPVDSPELLKLSLPTWAKAYNFSGDLRPALMSPRRPITNNRVCKPDYAAHPGGVSDSEQRDRASNNNIRVYGPDELEGECNLRYATKMGREVLDEGGKALRVGVTTDEIDRVIHEACMERDCYPSPLNYYNFPKSVCTSVNEVICHGIPDYREVQDGDIVNVDVTTYSRGGYHGDLNETFCVGNVDADGRRVVQTAFECLQGALAMVKPGTLYRDLGSTIQRVAAANKCSVVRTYCGHGIGSLFHTAPNVPHYAKNKAKGVMKEGHVFTVEPMINLGSYADLTWGDNWTAVTSDGKRSAQFEHTVLVTKDGCEILTARENEPVMKWDPDLIQR
mmetsp:Transcript_23616/g.50543  ORF Transcript_23616/g.50543 Transcript_23616/m.50543 type:complete len:412 (-) Transcript_23616:118-1353(-)|eukprot:CAMPEP_0172554092 /NCGR_PEP_ID=MMETSP1067-20121228/53161_1 /TAXON_ID=265564 ORGANISM="Thalassiosira punctigera, Strain Tpunct2005C2" /NCGR_SAMPLE_ID=MMETSP1067 /ASSEMBLY_ACC=CAM_ASM_000444 /LENGTH=411 /DNA_ID=CAMNT_0013342401 /DNA_START=132 /DNA_END=1367 /DNA_ORIENTATION=+